RNSRILVKLFQNASSAFSSSSSSVIADVSPPQDLRKGKTFTVSYLVDSLGLTTILAESISTKISSEGMCNNPDSVLGFDEGDVWEMFKKCPFSLTLSEEKITQSFETFKMFGLLEDEICSVFKRFPPCIGSSAETVKKKTEFLVKEMNWPIKAVIVFPHVFGYSFEKRIVPRCNVIKALMSKRLLGSELPPMSSVLSCTDQMFLKRNFKPLMFTL
ncbi:unnamed protein product, partial [Thlaspi arvense]